MKRFALLFAIGMALGLPFLGGSNVVEFFFTDLRVVTANAFGGEGDRSDRIAVILMDRDSEQKLGLPFGSAWRRFHPDVVKTLVGAGAELIVFDAEFIAHEPALDPAMAATFALSGRVMAGEDVAGATAEGLSKAFAGLGNLRIHSYSTVPRRVIVGGERPPISIVAATFLSAPGGAKADLATPMKRDDGFWINYTRRPSYFPAFSYADVLGAADGRLADSVRTPLSVFSGKAVLIGDGTDQDSHPFPPALGARMPGVFGQAYALDTLLNGRAPGQAPFFVDAMSLAIFCVALAFATRIRRPLLRTACALGILVAAFALWTALYSGRGPWLSFTPIVVSFWALLVADRVERRISLQGRLRRAVGFDPALIDAFRRERSRAGGIVRHDVAVLIADIRNFTSYVSRTDSAHVTRVLGEYMKAMEGCVGRRGGYVNKYVGDEIVAVFGFPLSGENASTRAVRAAIDMLAELSRLREGWAAAGIPSIRDIGIGIDRGPAAFVEVGGRSKSQFDIVGDCINGASRIEALTKERGLPLLLSSETWTDLSPEDGALFVEIGREPIRGQGERLIYGYRPT